jgi:hypothetical protein
VAQLFGWREKSRRTSELKSYSLNCLLGQIRNEHTR